MHPGRELATEALVGPLGPVSLGDQLGDRDAVGAGRQVQPDSVLVGVGEQPLGQLVGKVAILEGLAAGVAVRDRTKQLFVTCAHASGRLEGDPRQRILGEGIGRHVDGGTMAEAPRGDEKRFERGPS